MAIRQPIIPGTAVFLVRSHGYVLPVPIPGIVETILPDAVEVTHDAHDCDGNIPKGTLGFDCWPLDEIEIQESCPS